MFRTDLAVFDENRQLVLTVETKRLKGLTKAWAIEMRHSLMVNGYPRARFFLLATPDKFYLWVDANNGIENTSPDFAVDPTSFLSPIYAEFGTGPQEASSFLFEQVVGRWIKSIMYPGFSDSHLVPNWVSESGLEKAVFQGDVEFEIAA